MAGRALAASSMAVVALCRRSHRFNKLLPFSLPHVPLRHFHSPSSLDDVLFKVFRQKLDFQPLCDGKRLSLAGCLHAQWRPLSNVVDKVVDLPDHSESSGTIDGPGETKLRRKKLKGKRAVVRWLKCFRWKKKKEYERMTADEKILFKLKKARKKEERLVEALKKIAPAESSEPTHDPEILTPEEHFFFLKMGLKCKNYVPVGRRGIYQGVILNMHLHWKKHQTVQVVVKTFSPEEVKEIAAELARLTGGIVLDIHEENTIIMYRGKNYCQPPTEIMSPRITLSRTKALDKSKYRDGLRAVRKYIPRLEQDLELLQAQAQNEVEVKKEAASEIQTTDIGGISSTGKSKLQLANSEKLREILGGNDESNDDDSNMDLGAESDSENLSDIFETETEADSEDKGEEDLFLDIFDKFPVETAGESKDIEDHLRQVSVDTRNAKPLGKVADSPDLDEVDRMFLRAASLLKKKRR
ncbi:CRM domain-containing protein [Psidium guajava]|nr:CRM domain-containing protein [Psidium guajava]